MGETASERIPVKPTTKDRLAEFCGKARTYDEAINELLNLHEKVVNEEV